MTGGARLSDQKKESKSVALRRIWDLNSVSLTGTQRNRPTSPASDVVVSQGAALFDPDWQDGDTRNVPDGDDGG
jgi:hypothetical protein